MWLLAAVLGCGEAPSKNEIELVAMDELVQELRDAEAYTAALKAGIDDGTIRKADLTSELSRQPSLTELGYVRAPIIGPQRLDAYAARRIDGEVQRVPIDELEDYRPEDPEQDRSGLWVDEMEAHAPGWIGETCDDVAMTHSARYAMPLAKGGFAFTHLDLHQLSEALHKVPTGPEGYIALRDTETGRYLVHHGDSDCVYHHCSALGALPGSFIPPDTVRPDADAPRRRTPAGRPRRRPATSRSAAPGSRARPGS